MRTTVSVPTLFAAVAAAAIAAPALAQWSADPAAQLVVSNAAGDQNQAKVRANPNGGYYVSWLGTQGTGWDTWVQRLDEAGNPLWAAGGIVAADTNFSSTEEYGFAVDSAGNAIVAFRDNSTGITQIGIQKVSPTGELLFGPNGITVSAATGGSDSGSVPGVVVTSDGSYVVSYGRGNNAWYSKVDPSGNLLWGGGAGISIVPTSNRYTPGGMVASNDGSVIAVLQTAGGFTANRRVHAQKLDGATGAQLWNAGAPIVVQVANQHQVGYFPPVISDSNGGAIVAWYELPNGAFQCRVQRITSDGAFLFPAGGAEAAVIAGQMRVSPAIAHDPVANETYVFYTEEMTSQGSQGVSGQKLDAAGARLWTDAGVQVTPLGGLGTNPGFINTTLTTGGVIVSFFEGTDAAASTAVVKAAKVAADGTLPWESGVVTVNSNGGSAKARMNAVDAPDGASILVYADKNAGDHDITATRIGTDGVLGGAGGPDCPADWNGDETVNSSDISAFLTGWLASVTAPDLTADFNGDGTTNSSDISSFLTAWLDAVVNGC